MKPTAYLLALSALVLLSTACSQEAQPAPPPQPVAQHKPTESRLVERVSERWRLAAAKEWIDVYNYLTPKIRKEMSIYAFLDGKEHHVFEQPSAPRIVATDGKQAFVEVSITWTPTHPMLQKVEIPEGASLTERFELLETWEWAGDDWYVNWPPERPNEFFERRPDLLKKKNATASAPAGDN